jgi:hypothetical protein
MLMEIYLKYIVKVIENDYMPKSIQKYLGGWFIKDVLTLLGLVIPFLLFNLYVFNELINNVVPSIHSEFFLRVPTTIEKNPI